MTQTIGKIASVDIINKTVTIEVDKSQTQNINDKYYYPLIYVFPNSTPTVVALIIELEKDVDKPTFSFQIDCNASPRVWHNINQCKDHSIAFKPNKIITSPTKKISINDLEELILI